MRGKWGWLTILAVLATATLLWAAPAGAGPANSRAPLIVTASIDGGITNASADYLESALRHAEGVNAQALVIEIDTPGGLLDATRRIVRAILSAKVAVVTHVAPAGARAGSAGLFIVLGSHVATMTETSNMGAAHPVSAFGSDVEGDMGAKVLNDTAAWARTLAETRGRNVEWAAKAVTESASITAREALDQKVIDLLAADLPSLLAAIHGRSVTVSEETYALMTQGVKVEAFSRTPVQELYEFLSNPSLLYLLLLMGIFGVYIEFNHPGLIVPGLLGAVCLGIVLGMQVLPINWFGASLIGLSVVLFIAEVYVTSFGILGFAGLGCLIAGSYILFSVPGSSFLVDRILIWTVSAAFAVVLIGIGSMLVRAKRQGPTSGVDTLLGAETRVVQAVALGGVGRVFIDGTFWNAKSDRALTAGQKVRVVGREGLLLSVEPLEAETGSSQNPHTPGPIT